MKKIIILITLILLLSGCNKLNITDDITNITYNNYQIDESDYKDILNDINRITFYCGKRQNYNDSTLVIKTNEEIFNFHLSNNYYMEYQKDNKYCYTRNQDVVKNFVDHLDKLINKYMDINEYHIEYKKNYIETDDDFNIRLDKSDNYIVINTNKKLTCFKINEIEYIDGKYEEVNLIYNSDFIDKDNIVIRKKIDDNPNIKISFINTYGYVVNIIPVINENEEISFDIQIN